MFKVFHHQVRGRGHVLDGSPCQDMTASASRHGVQVVCLSDGAGSARLSHYGAQAVVDEGTRLLVENFMSFTSRGDGARIKAEIVSSLLARLTSLSARLECHVKDLASTMLAVATHGDQFVVVHIGDGVIGYVRDGELRIASSPDNDEFANTTTFVTSSSAITSMRLLRGSLEGVTGFILMSDGAAESLYNQRTKMLAPACLKLVRLLADSPTYQTKNPIHRKRLRKFLATRVREATKDDCSLALLARLPALSPSSRA
ncbi:protein phosphatase 2C domain-containing protein [Flavimobilis sp. GY10621]|uniref:Protein phosphatase 2C domain-containing protein n=1 Tax=Flavimobilis rhizosphaerae TaxID=2775421 RepID=A0ABR9DRA7_9MICO|nr:PP2C family serine/threonine-protein phosphatase [Flavimobilis rhizosphaerae]MBD9699449.1 protein phosphatase 2C domain-containing protein [Flavimobilis rhizosphaerae]